MGAGASTHSLDDFGPFGDVNAVKAFAGDKFDQVKFDELKDSDGFVTKEQLAELIAAMPSESDGAAAEAAAAVPDSPVTIHLTALQGAIDAARAAGKTPLIVDNSESHAVDTFFGYNAILVDAKQCSLNVALKKSTKEESLETARKCVVNGMKNGATCVIACQQGSPSFNQWFNTESEFPVEALMTNSGLGFLEKDAAVKLYRDEDLQHGFAIVQEKFNVVVTTWFSPEDFEEFLFDSPGGMKNLSKELFQFIIVETD